MAPSPARFKLFFKRAKIFCNFEFDARLMIEGQWFEGNGEAAF